VTGLGTHAVRDVRETPADELESIEERVMKDLVAEFKAFINKGDVVMIAVGLVMALYFKSIVDAIIEGVIDPIVAAIFGESSIREIGFSIGDAHLSVGLVIGAAIDFIIVAVVLFLLLRVYNRWKTESDESDAGPTEVQLLTDIRDSLRRQ
jgi:large conductance mechanosensitive channel